MISSAPVPEPVHRDVLLIDDLRVFRQDLRVAARDHLDGDPVLYEAATRPGPHD